MIILKMLSYSTPFIKFYAEMETMFGSGIAIGRFAHGSNKPLGVSFIQADSAAGRMEGTSVNQGGDEKD